MNLKQTVLSWITLMAFLSASVSSQSNTTTTDEDWREVKEGVDGYPAGNMLEIALRRTPNDKLEMFKWRSEFIAMLGVQRGPLVEREWKTLSSWPPMTGAGTWTGMTWWENQQSWHDMANMVFPSPVTANWLATIDMTLLHAHANDEDFDLRTLAQSGEEVLELGILAYPSDAEAAFETALEAYRAAIESNGAVASYTFDLFSNGYINGPLTTAYNKNGPPLVDGSEAWKVYMAVWESIEDHVSATSLVEGALDALKAATVQEHSSIDVATRSTSKVCCASSGQCLLDPEMCQVTVLGMNDTWASNCAQCPRPCDTDYGVCSMLSTKTCNDIGGMVKPSRFMTCDDVNATASDDTMDDAGTTSGALAMTAVRSVLVVTMLVGSLLV